MNSLPADVGQCVSAPPGQQVAPPELRRLILRLRKGPEVQYVGHLDLMRVLERAVRRAGLPVAYTEGYNPRTKIALASALAVGATSEWEICQLDLSRAPRRAELPALLADLRRQLPPGLEILAADLIRLEKAKPYLQALAASYCLTLLGEEAAKQIEGFLTQGPGLPEASDVRWRETSPKEISLHLKLPIGGGGVRLRDVRARLEKELPGLSIVHVHRARLWCAAESALITGSSIS